MDESLVDIATKFPAGATPTVLREWLCERVASHILAFGVSLSLREALTASCPWKANHSKWTIDTVIRGLKHLVKSTPRLLAAWPSELVITADTIKPLHDDIIAFLRSCPAGRFATAPPLGGMSVLVDSWETYVRRFWELGGFPLLSVRPTESQQAATLETPAEMDLTPAVAQRPVIENHNLPPRKRAKIKMEVTPSAAVPPSHNTAVDTVHVLLHAPSPALPVAPPSLSAAPPPPRPPPLMITTRVREHWPGLTRLLALPSTQPTFSQSLATSGYVWVPAAFFGHNWDCAPSAQQMAEQPKEGGISHKTATPWRVFQVAQRQDLASLAKIHDARFRAVFVQLRQIIPAAAVAIPFMLVVALAAAAIRVSVEQHNRCSPTDHAREIVLAMFPGDVFVAHGTAQVSLERAVANEA